MGTQERNRTHTPQKEAQELLALPELANSYAIALANILSRGGTIPQGWMRPLSVYQLFPIISNTGTHMMSWDDSGHHLQLYALKKVKLATTDPRDTRDHHPALNLAGGLIGSVIVRPDIRSTAPRSIDQHVRSLVELASENLDIFTIGAVNRIGSVNASVVQKFHQTMQRQLDTAMKA